MKTISAEKMANMITMYDRFIPPNPGQTTYHLFPHQLLQPVQPQLPQLLNQQQLFRAHVERESTANAPQKGVMALVTKILPNGLKVNHQSWLPSAKATCIACNDFITSIPVFFSLLLHDVISVYHMVDF